MLTAPNEGLSDQLDYILSAAIPGALPWLLVLWTNDDLVPDQDTVWADVTEATFQGYSRVTMGRSDWTSATIIANAAVSTWGTSPTIWTPTGDPEAVYGYAIITAVSPVIRYIEPFPTPVTAAVGAPVGVLPRVTLTTLPVMSGAKIRSRSRGAATSTRKR